MKRLTLGAALAALMCLAAAPCYAADAQKQTRLRVGTPSGTFENWGLGARLSQASVEVRNVGEADAQGVSVRLTLPDGGNMALSGPSTLGKNQSATYSGSGWKHVYSTKKLSASASCSNCRK
jgi:hypothetical protein